MLSALLFFEYAITLDREVNLFWKRKFTGATTLFLANRYIPLLLQVVDMCGYAQMSDKVSIVALQLWNVPADVSFHAEVKLRTLSGSRRVAH